MRFHVYANTRLAGHRVMNCEIHNLPPLRCEAFQATECVRALVHTVLFTRALGVVFPVDKECELFDITYVTVGDPSVSRVVELRLVELAAWLDSKTKGKRETHTKVVVSFRESVGDDDDTSTASASSSKSHCWEQWRVPLEILCIPESAESAEQHQGRKEHALEVQDELRGALAHVLQIAGDAKKNIPPVTTNALVSFPFHVAFAHGDSEKHKSATTLGQIKKLITTASPPNMRLV